MSIGAPHWHVFCRVVDNFGDAGVALRFCRQLSLRQDEPVTLFIDDISLIHSLMDKRDLQLFEIKNWPIATSTLLPAARIISLFGCALPQEYIELAKSTDPLPHWINVEHLSAESWIESFHLIPSPHPPLVEYFFYPGFTTKSGGLIHEEHLQLSVSDKHSVFSPNDKKPILKIFIFCYHSAPLISLVTSLHKLQIACQLIVPEDLPLSAELKYWQQHHLNSSLTFIWLPRLVQTEFDQYLMASDLVFVRGEDTWARAQLMGKPLIWHIYPQEKDAHWLKLEAFLTRYSEPSNAKEAITRLYSFHQKWNKGLTITPEDCQALLDNLMILKEHAQIWQHHLLVQTDLIDQLIHFIEKNDKK
ncbi:elongation factor P maturation arginine rhamnosyltransferase EarP [Ferrovum sp. PN-J185]|uniref:elongation factor P maturation arginine rhamnosyltransferase EarP n=1 Tax=Ferrovum sp. PN-J185 TaxID=1356306 RepID=UPI001E328935|nr:elongation factor P maturation arginine rhamnosyltransferase EarP [Ferrovum sp. PN-J185]MCC6068422.1 elongation factor P maturation arginine rhamnosyltransferase EarP [Ferrovum sp. PN-J185]MDE1891528.1 elongation factor P maturation arginine rhamnosyltransferase EarP [Betaproteobacteria bacterium]MDE2055862.1 elongation factor P maturation arginine rhamnosyltransferase EarP [Betaproteobacteria bacterium]